MIQRLSALLFGCLLVVLALAPVASAQPTCGNEGQPGCGIFRTDCVSKNLKIAGGVCVHPNCGRDGQQACDALTRFPSCDIGLVEAPGAVCRVQGMCGAAGQRVCIILDAKPACDPGLINVNGMCAAVNCGRADQAACNIIGRARCEAGLVDFDSVCRVRGACGTDGQRRCLAGEPGSWEPLTGCSRNLAPENNVCKHPNCGRANEARCSIAGRSSCDDDLVEFSGTCRTRGACGTEGQRRCLASEPGVWEALTGCARNLVPQGDVCTRPACGRADEAACAIPGRSSCDGDLVEFNNTCKMRGACGAEGQRRCLAGEPGQWEALTGCSVGLIVDQSVCLRPQCGREGERACSFFHRLPSCDAGLVEKDGRCAKSDAAACGGERQRACDLDERLPSCRAGLMQDGKSCRHEFDVEGACILFTDKGPLPGNLTKPLSVRRGEREDLAPLDQGIVRGSCRNTNGDLVETQIDPTGCVGPIFADWSGKLRCSRGTLPDTKGHYRKFCPQAWMEDGALHALCLDKVWDPAGDYYWPPKFPSSKEPPSNHRYDYREQELKSADQCRGGVFWDLMHRLYCAESMPEGDYLEKCTLVAPTGYANGGWFAECPSDVGLIEKTGGSFSDPFKLQSCKEANVNKYGKLVCTR